MKIFLYIKSYSAEQKKGFTLMELLLVVAIISVLVALSIPIINAQLDKARASVDLANERSAKGAAVVEYLLSVDDIEKTYYFDAAAGRVKDTAPAKGYGKSTTRPAGSLSEADSPVPKGGYVKVTVYADGNVKLWWAGGSGGSGAPPSTVTGGLDNGGIITTWEDLIGPDGLLTVDSPNVDGSTGETKWAVTGVQPGKTINGILYIREGLTDITQDVFNGQTGLKQVHFPATMRVVSARAFAGSGLTEITITDNINDMGENAFSDLADLNKVTWHYNPTSTYESTRYLLTGSATPDKKITIDFYGTQAQWNTVKGKIGLEADAYILNLRN